MVGIVLVAVSLAMGFVALLRDRLRPSVMEAICLVELFVTGSFFMGLYIWLKIIETDESCINAGNVFSGIVVYVTFFTSMVFFITGLMLAVMLFVKFALWIKNVCCGKCCGSEPILVPSSLAKIKFDPEFFTQQSECAICLSAFERNDEVSPLHCDVRHYFHTDCIKDWLARNPVCPLCKTNIESAKLKKFNEGIQKEIKVMKRESKTFTKEINN